MNKLITVFLVLAASLGMSAKNNPLELKGKVYDENGEAMPYVTVALISLPDSSIVGGTTTDLDGVYSIQTELSRGLLMFSMLGYNDVYSTFAEAAEMHMTLAENILGEAVVKAVMPKTRLTGDGMITSISGSVLENVGSANDALARVPGIVRSQSGLEVIGKGSPLVYINGRKVTDNTELERLQSFEIQSIEVINNPGAQYDASVRSVVRIRTIRRQGEGFGFNMGLTDEQSLRYKDNNDPMAYLNANWRHGSLDIFAGGSYLIFNNVQDAELTQETKGGTVFSQEGTMLFRDRQQNTGANGGFNWQIADNHFVGARVESSVDLSDDTHQVVEYDYFLNGAKTDHITAIGDLKTGTRPATLRTNVYYNGQAGKLGIDLNADYYEVGTSQLSHTEENSEMEEDDIVNTSSSTESRLYATKLVLSYPVWKGKLELGTEETFTRSNDRYDIVSDHIPSSLSEMSEDNIAFFAQYGCQIPKVGQLSAGLRYEHVDYAYDDKSGSEDLSKTYDNIFPSLSFSTQLGKLQGSLSYSVKTDRPSLSMFSNAIRYHSRSMIQCGNSRLQPETLHEMAMNLHWEFLTLVTQYSRQENPIVNFSSLYSADGMILLRPVNMDNPIKTFECYLNASPSVGIWNMNYTVGIQDQRFELDYQISGMEGSSELGHLSYSNHPVWIAQMYNTFSFKNNWKAEIGGEYRSKGYQTNILNTNHFLNLSMAVEKSLLKDNALVIRLAASDLTGTFRYAVEADSGNHIIRQSNTFDRQRLSLSLRYNFNSVKSKYRGTGAGNEAAGRMR